MHPITIWLEKPSRYEKEILRKTDEYGCESP